MANSNIFFNAVASKLVNKSEYFPSAGELRSVAINYILREWPSFPEITNLLEYSERIMQPESTIDRHMMVALANEFNLTFNLHIDRYIINISREDRDDDNHIDLFFRDGEYFLFDSEEPNEEYVNINLNDVVRIVLQEDRDSLFYSMTNAGLIDVNQIDNQGNSLLHRAALANAVEIAAVIADDQIVDPFLLNNNGNLASDYSYSDAMEFILYNQILHNQNLLGGFSFEF